MANQARSLFGGVFSIAIAAAVGGSAQAQIFVPVNEAVVPVAKIAAPAAVVPSAVGGVKPTGSGVGTVEHHAGAGTRDGGNYMIYNGGPLLIGTKHLYYIWYGDWSKNTDAIQILQDFGQNVGGSAYFNINTSYTNAQGAHVQNSAVLANSIFDQYSQGKALGPGAVQNIAVNAIQGGMLPNDPMGVYFVLTSPDVTETMDGWNGFCSAYCGYHNYTSVGGSSVQYSFVGNPEQCPKNCSSQLVSPNGNMGADGMVSVLAHELEEATTDPHLDAWYTNYGMENGDMCAWNFGSTQALSNGAHYNQTIGKRKYLIQQNWVNATPGYCAQSY